MAEVPATLTFRTKTWVADWLRDYASSDRRSMSNLISGIVEEWVVRERGVDAHQGQVGDMSSKGDEEL